MNFKNMVYVDCFIQCEPGVRILDNAKCNEKCTGKECVYICPAGIFKEKEEKLVLDEDGVCLECGACRLICDNIRFDYPEGGKGILHRFG